jgi:signal transduction histidine kinase
VPLTVAAVTLGGVAAFAYRLSGRMFFRATAKFRPTIQQLADELASRRDIGEIRQSIQAAVMRWLPTGSASILLPHDLHLIANVPGGHRERLMSGQAVWTAETAWRRQLMVPMRSRGDLRGVLLLAPKHQSALYTREDLQLLDTIASLGAVALHNADVIAEVEALRRLELDAARDEKRLVLGMLGAEISHEIAYPLNFLRYLMAQGQDGRALDATDFDIGREEIGRLERMFATLRKLSFPSPRLEPVPVLVPVRRALDLIREIIQTRQLTVQVSVPPELSVDAEPDALVQIFANLLRNAAQAVGDGQTIGVRSSVSGVGSTVLEVWDQGPGVSAALAPTIFNPFVTSKEGSMGLGLAVTHRLVRRFGWSISASRTEGEMTFRIEIPRPSAGRRHQEG